jgi:pimeloyl-ACP methyl ester carboxylesterase
MAKDATSGLVDLVEAMHVTIAKPVGGGGISGLVYKTIRGVTHLVGGGVDALLSLLKPTLQERQSSPGREAVHAALNGVLGDYLEASGNPLAIRMSLRQGGLPFAPKQLDRKVAVLVHGLCMSDLQWKRKGHDHGAALARDLGYTPAYLHYNTGRHIARNGRDFAELLERLVRSSGIEELVIVGHSMGGLVTRSALHHALQAGHAWPRRLKGVVFLGTPHHGAPLERGGNWIDILLGSTRYSAPFARLGMIRSAGITDLRYGSVLEGERNARAHVPLPPRVRCYAIAGSKGRLVGDGLVPVDSALGRHKRGDRNLEFPPDRQWIARGVNHLDLLSSKAVYSQLRKWLSPNATD